MAVVISKVNSQSHTVNKYKFKVLSSSGHSEHAETDESQTEGVNETLSQETIENHEISSSSKDELVESLLKKTDEMSSNFIKLQMKLEDKESECKAEIEKVQKESYEKGLSDAKEELKSETQLQEASSIEQFAKSVTALEQTASEFKAALERIENELINAAVDIAKEVILVELNENSAAIATKLSHELIEDLKESSKVTLKVNPKDHGYVSEKVGKLEHIEIVSDSAISPGGVVAISESGNIDSEIMKRYERVKKAALGG